MDRIETVTPVSYQEVYTQDFNPADVGLEVETPLMGFGTKTLLEGAWRATDALVSGDAAPQIVGQTLRMAGNRFQISKDDELLYGGFFRLDLAGHPAVIEFDQFESESLMGTWLGIFRIVGDKLLICDNAPNLEKRRPKSFGASVSPGYVLVQYTRED